MSLIFDPSRLANASLADLDARRRKFWILPDLPDTVWNYAHGLTVPDSEDDAGDLEAFDPNSHPAQRHAIKVVDERRHTHYTFAADTQDGKSWLIQLITFHAVIERGQKVVIALPNRNLASDVWVGKLRPAIIGSGQERFLPTQGAGSQNGSTPRVVQFERDGGKGGGQLIWMSAQGRKEAGQASLTAPDVVLDELDDWERQAVQRIERRADKFASDGRARFFKASTVKADTPEASNILSDWLIGSRGRIGYECEACDAFTRMQWDTFNPERATVRCEHCGAEIDDEIRGRMLSKSELLEEDPRSTRFSLLWTALDSPWKSLAWLAEQYRIADAARQHGDHTAMRQYYRDQRVECYDGDLDVANITKDQLRARSGRSTYERGVVPYEAEAIAVAVDIQKDRAYWLALAGNRAGLNWVIDWGEEYFMLAEDGTPLRKREPSDAERERVLDQIRAMASDGWPRPNGDPLGTEELLGVDIGYRSEAVGRWVRSRNAFAVRGDKSKKLNSTRLAGAMQTGRLVKEYNGGLMSRRRQQKIEPGQPVYWWFIRSRDSRDRTRAGLLLPEGEPGSIALPGEIGARSMLFSHLTCWRMETDKETGQAVWTKHGDRDDLDDCLIYAWNLLRMELDQGRVALQSAPEPEGTSADSEGSPAPEEPEVYGGGYDDGGGGLLDW